MDSRLRRLRDEWFGPGTVHPTDDGKQDQLGDEELAVLEAAAAATPDQLADVLKLLYEKNAETMSSFLDWRHKVILLFATMVGLVLSIEAWLYTHFARTSYVIALAIPFLFGAVGARQCAKLDRRNGEIINQSYSVGGRLEEALRRQAGLGELFPLGNYEQLAHYRRQITNRLYGTILKRAYNSVALAFFLLAFAAVVLGAARF